MKRNCANVRRMVLWVNPLLLALVISSPRAQAQSKVDEFFDQEYGYFFKYPAGWAIHKLPAGKPIVIAGIHAFPFGKDYSINFVMTAFWDPAAKQDQEMLTAIFNSFRLSGENRPGETPDNHNAPGEKPDVSE